MIPPLNVLSRYVQKVPPRRFAASSEVMIQHNFTVILNASSTKSWWREDKLMKYYATVWIMFAKSNGSSCDWPRGVEEGVVCYTIYAAADHRHVGHTHTHTQTHTNTHTDTQVHTDTAHHAIHKQWSEAV